MPAAAGHWGTDCALSYSPDGKVELLADTGYKQQQDKPLFYVYELAPIYHVWWVPACDGKGVRHAAGRGVWQDGCLADLCRHHLVIEAAGVRYQLTLAAQL